MKTCVLTGHSGLIGYHLLAELKRDWEIYILSRRPQPEEIHESNLHYITADFSRDWSTNNLPEKTDAVIHLSQSEHFKGFPDLAEELFTVNTISTLRLLHYAREAEAKIFILASTGGLYGYGKKAFSEDDFVSSDGELGYYFSTKLCSEILSKSYSTFMNVVVLRFFFVYGPNQKNIMLIPRLVESVLNNKQIILQGDNGLKINPVYVLDAVKAIISSLELNDSHNINIAGPEVLTLEQIVEKIGRIVKKKPLYEKKPDETPRHLIGDISKMIELLAEPQVKFEEGIAEYLKSL